MTHTKQTIYERALITLDYPMLKPVMAELGIKLTAVRLNWKKACLIAFHDNPTISEADECLLHNAMRDLEVRKTAENHTALRRLFKAGLANITAGEKP